MEQIFFSDVHLGAFSRKKNSLLENEIITLVRYCKKHSIQIHILGDLFDYWMECPDFIPELGKKLLDEFEQYNKNLRATFITGNHDYWTISHFSDRGFAVHSEELILSFGDKKILLFHGDGLANKNFGLPRPRLNHFLRNHLFVKAYQQIFSGKTANTIMKKFSDFTRDHENFSPERLSLWSKSFFKHNQMDYIITGHDHVPRVETFEYGTYLNCGAFYRDQTVVRYTNNRFEIVVWNGNRQMFEPYDKTFDRAEE